MKKKLALLLACTMAFGLTACGGGGTAATTAAPAPTEAATEAATEAPAGDKKEETEAASEAAGGMDALIEAAKAEGS